jgi:hypothetical protein
MKTGAVEDLDQVILPLIKGKQYFIFNQNRPAYENISIG